MNNSKKEPAFSDVYLKKFVKNNNHCIVSVEEDKIIIDKPWSRDDARLISDINDQKFISDLNNVQLSHKFDAIFHSDEGYVEFVYNYLNPKSESNKEIVDRLFTIHYEGHEYKCYFAEPTERLYRIASKFERLPSESGVTTIPQIVFFKDSQRLDELPERIKLFFSGKLPRSFFIESKTTVLNPDEFESLAKHINFLMSYYDRSSPMIILNSEIEDDTYEHKKPLNFIEKEFPKTLSVQPIDDIILKLIDIAKKSHPRFR